MGHVRTGLRMCTSAAHHFAPFQVIYKQDPVLPGTFLPDKTFPSSMDVPPGDVSSITERLISAFEAARNSISTALLR